MVSRLTKAQVEELLTHLDGPVDEVRCALADAVEALTGSRDLDAVLRSRGREQHADALAAGDEATAWALATELNENRRL